MEHRLDGAPLGRVAAIPQRAASARDVDGFDRTDVAAVGDAARVRYAAGPLTAQSVGRCGQTKTMVYQTWLLVLGLHCQTCIGRPMVGSPFSRSRQ
jgi:hypothetical protein